MAEQSFNLFSDALVVSPNDFEILSDALVLPPTAFALTSDATLGEPIIPGIFALTSDALLTDSVAHGQGVRERSDSDAECRTCLELDCGDTELVDFYSLDGPIFQYQLICPPGFLCENDSFQLLCCDRLLQVTIPPTATIQQRNEIIASFIRECQRIELSCGGPSIPPPKTGPTTPTPGTPNPPAPPPPIQFFYNNRVVCEIPCANGGTFSYAIAAGKFLAASQIKANQLALKEACKLAKTHRICLEPKELEACAGEGLIETYRATGALARFPEQNTWEVIGTLPPGLTATEGFSNDPFMAISGTPTTPGTYTFTIKVSVWTRGDSQQREYTITILDCPTDFGNITPDIFSNTVSYWNSGDSIIAGTYKVSYVNGAMGYGQPNKWYVNADDYQAGGFNAGFKIKLPSSEINFPNPPFPNNPFGDYPSQAAVEAAYAGQFQIINHAGGPIGMYLKDSPYNDNINGSPNPTFLLTKL